MEQAMDEATCRRVQAAMDAGVREPTEVIGDDMTLVEDVQARVTSRFRLRSLS